MDIPPLSQLIKCDNLESCFQALYNFFFGILVALAFVYFLWGAIEYLLSGSTFTSKDSGKKKMINSIIALIVTLIIPVIVYWINPEIFGEHQLNVYEYQGDAYNVDSPTGIGGERPADPGSGLIYLDTLGLSNIIDVTGSARISTEIENKLKTLDDELKRLGFKIYITHAYNGPGSNYDRCHGAGKALDIIIDPRDDISKWNTLIGIIKSVDPNALIVAEALCDGLPKADPSESGLNIPSWFRCKNYCKEEKDGQKIVWCQTKNTTGSRWTRARHLHVCFDIGAYFRR